MTKVVLNQILVYAIVDCRLCTVLSLVHLSETARSSTPFLQNFRAPHSLLSIRKYMVGAEMKEVYPVRFRKLKLASLWRAHWSFHAEPDKLPPSRHQPCIQFILFLQQNKLYLCLPKFKNTIGTSVWHPRNHCDLLRQVKLLRSEAYTFNKILFWIQMSISIITPTMGLCLYRSVLPSARRRNKANHVIDWQDFT